VEFSFDLGCGWYWGKSTAHCLSTVTLHARSITFSWGTDIMGGATLRGNKSSFGRMRVTHRKDNCGVGWRILKAVLAKFGKILRSRLAPDSRARTAALSGSCNFRPSTKVKVLQHWGVHQSFHKKISEKWLLMLSASHPGVCSCQ